MEFKGLKQQNEFKKNEIDTTISSVIKGVIAEGKLCPKVIISFNLFGQPAEYDNVRVGVNPRLDTLQAALLLPKY